MYLQVTVVLGIPPFWGSRFDRLLSVISNFALHTKVETPDSAQPQVDNDGRWSYTFEIVSTNPKAVRSYLHDNGRFKILQMKDLTHNSYVPLPKRKTVAKKT